jgi:hypothetical protein
VADRVLEGADEDGVEAVQGVADVVEGVVVVARSRVLGISTVDCMHIFVRTRIRLGPGRSNRSASHTTLHIAHAGLSKVL